VSTPDPAGEPPAETAATDPEGVEEAAASAPAAAPEAADVPAPPKPRAAADTARPVPKLPPPPRAELIAYAVIWAAVLAAVAVLTARG
jgi:hypothetical protein